MQQSSEPNEKKERIVLHMIFLVRTANTPNTEWTTVKSSYNFCRENIMFNVGYHGSSNWLNYNLVSHKLD